MPWPLTMVPPLTLHTNDVQPVALVQYFITTVSPHNILRQSSVYISMPFLLLTFIIALAVSLHPQSFKLPSESTTDPDTVRTTVLGPGVVKT